MIRCRECDALMKSDTVIIYSYRVFCKDWDTIYINRAAVVIFQRQDFVGFDRNISSKHQLARLPCSSEFS